MNEKKNVVPNEGKRLENVSDTELRNADVIVEACENFFQVMRWPAYIVNLSEGRIVFVSDSLRLLCGQRPDEGAAADGDICREHVHEEDLRMMRALREDICKKMMESAGTEHHKYCARVHIRVRVGDKYRLFNHSSAPICWSEDGRPLVVLCLLLPSSQRRAGNASLYRSGDNCWYSYDSASREWEERPLPVLADREKDMLRLSAQGYTARKMAAALCKSEESIKIYKKSLFKKLGVSNMSAALTFALNYGLL